jgi:hypothetical protein
VRLAAAAPTWAICALAAVGATSVVTVAGIEHAPVEVAAADAVPAETPETAVTHVTPAETATRPLTDEDRAVPVSRSAPRTASARPGVRARRKHTPAHRGPRQHHRRGKHASHVPAAPSDAAETVASALDSSVNVPGQCLAWSREQAGIPSRYSDAATAWEHATGRHRADRNPPRGAAVYWTGGSRGYGHIAISLGGGRVRSSDADGYGEVGTIRINKLSSEWDLHYAGWANSINGYRIPGVRAA